VVLSEDWVRERLGEKATRAAMTEVTVTEARHRFSRKDRLVHLCELPLPRGAVVLCDGRRMASPPLLFLQMAGELDIHRLILLGLQLCAHPPGRLAEAITTVSRLTAFAEKCHGHQGRRKALRALRYVQDGSASPMESLAFMLLTLPHMLGGYGLHGAAFNQEIPLTPEARRRLGQQRCFADLYYRQARLALEYDSFAHHHTPTEQGRDLVRASVLERLGIEVMRFGTIQLYERTATEELARNVAARLGRRLRVRTEAFEAAHQALRALLPKRGEGTGSSSAPL
jgi:hypothetical protein